MSHDDGERCIVFDCGDEHGMIQVIPKCPQCGRFIKAGEVLMNGLGAVTFTGWLCGRDGEVQPDWDAREEEG